MERQRTKLFKKAKITIAPWPKYWPELNPQERVWAGSEPELRKSEDGDDRDTLECGVTGFCREIRSGGFDHHRNRMWHNP